MPIDRDTARAEFLTEHGATIDLVTTTLTPYGGLIEAGMGHAYSRYDEGEMPIINVWADRAAFIWMFVELSKRAYALGSGSTPAKLIHPDALALADKIADKALRSSGSNSTLVRDGLLLGGRYAPTGWREGASFEGLTEIELLVELLNGDWVTTPVAKALAALTVTEGNPA